MPIRIALVEDKRSDRDKFLRLFNSSPDLVCVAVCSTAKEALQKIPPTRPQIILMDIGLPGLSGIDCIPHLKALIPELQIIMLTILEDHEVIFQALQAGAMGYLLKSTSEPEILQAIRDLHAGGAPMSGQIAREVVSFFHKTPAGPESKSKLTDRQQEILRFLAQGKAYKTIADALGISPHTVNTHIAGIYAKLHVHNRTEALNKAFPKRA
jgi:DNA-binding NarL/FixJ family response regulator